MKTYAITAVRNDNTGTVGSPILTCSIETAINWREGLKIQSKNDNPNFHWEIWEYDLKTQGKNFNDAAFAKTFKEPF